MLISVGRGLSPAVSKPYAPAFKRLVMTSSLPQEVSFERASSATVTNINGQLVEVANHEPRFDHDEHGNRLGILIEPALTNKCQNYNANPTSTSGVSASGDVNGILSLVDDSSALTAVGLDQICTNGNVYRADNSAGTTDFVIQITGATGNLNPHSYSVYVRSPNSTGRTCRLASGAGELDIEGNTTWQRYIFENQTPDTTSREMTILVDAGKEIYFILNQLEEYQMATSVIKTQGASASRAADRPYVDNLTQYDWFDGNQGYFTCRYSLREILDQDSYIGVIHDGSSSDTVGLRLHSSNHALRGYVRAASSSQFTSNNSDVHMPNLCYSGGIRWNSTEVQLLSNGSERSGTMSALPNGLTRFEIGARNSGASPIHGHVQEVEIGKLDINETVLGRKLQRSSDIIIGGSGQSLMRGHFISQETNSDEGHLEHRRIIGKYLREKSVVMVDGSTGSSAASKTSNDTNYWWDLATDTAGPAFDTFINNMANAAVVPTYILWAQGEEDSHHIGSNTSRAQYKQALESIFTGMRHTYGDIPVFIQRIGRRTGFSNTGGVQTIREVQEELIAENDWCFEAAESYDTTLYDQVHLDDNGYMSVAARNSAAILLQQNAQANVTTGPEITDATLVGNTVTVTLSHDAGDNFTPSSNIEGFIFHDGSTSISITSTEQTNATTITLTLASTPSEPTKTLYYGYDDMVGLNTSNIVRDNSADQLPLRTAKIVVS
ncbi:MAG: hypothetical protein HRT94_00275 [Alphaproteobacteria bacterium]|nr:hypothetical protein [Alphaproteobacteria bacterium]